MGQKAQNQSRGYRGADIRSGRERREDDRNGEKLGKKRERENPPEVVEKGHGRNKGVRCVGYRCARDRPSHGVEVSVPWLALALCSLAASRTGSKRFVRRGAGAFTGELSLSERDEPRDEVEKNDARSDGCCEKRARSWGTGGSGGGGGDSE